MISSNGIEGGGIESWLKITDRIATVFPGNRSARWRDDHGSSTDNSAEIGNYDEDERLTSRSSGSFAELKIPLVLTIPTRTDEERCLARAELDHVLASLTEVGDDDLIRCFDDRTISPAESGMACGEHVPGYDPTRLWRSVAQCTAVGAFGSTRVIGSRDWLSPSRTGPGRGSTPSWPFTPCRCWTARRHEDAPGSGAS